MLLYYPLNKATVERNILSKDFVYSSDTLSKRTHTLYCLIEHQTLQVQ